ncbi:MAG TPA: type II secretion system protein [Hyphomicrobiales bacterium]|nr:type II secretion system protein [Hyphomicrobiales bacterium]
MRNGSCGFTLIELVAAIVIVGTLAAVTLARFAAQDPYAGVVVRDQIVAMARAAQHRSLGHAGVQLILQPQGDTLQMRIEDADGPLQSSAAPLRALLLSGKVNPAPLDSCASEPGRAITDIVPFTLEYQLPGDLVLADGSPVTSQVHLCLDGDPSLTVCIAATGFAYAGECVP